MANMEKFNSGLEEGEDDTTSLWTYVFSVDYLLCNLFFIVQTVRINTFPAWYYPWLQWSFSEGEAMEEGKEIAPQK